ncbi:lantibiotic dehydratase [Acinetobacter sp. ACIN00229]|uniref:lantibiotic dehydratase n=1 Tax=Acinetobacter sp. ACIN00229 TaxID=2792607 RepID=UPI0018DEF1F5|nr:lantibiotic dehydratase [Acinetobacter sp. ACIN00229]MBI0421294.1 lantibiotic dehydratase [Acinetobacter sp. ACIN00229]
MKIKYIVTYGKNCSNGFVKVPFNNTWPDHLLSPSSSGWTWWKSAVLRSAGFPAINLSILSDVVIGELADEANKAELIFNNQLANFIQALEDKVVILRKSEEYNYRKQELRNIYKIKKLIRVLIEQGFSAISSNENATVFPEELRIASIKRDEAFSKLKLGYPQALERLSQAIKSFAKDENFRKAIGWQNPEAVQTTVNALALDKSMSDSKRKQRESLIASYVQRYCVKNDTIGFFGPMAWVGIEKDLDRSEFRIGHNLVRSSSVHFEDWVIETLALKIASNDKYIPWLVAFREPFLYVENNILYFPNGNKVQLSENEARLLVFCDGIRTAGEIAKIILADPFSLFTTMEEVFAGLRELERMRRIKLAFPIPSCPDNPDLALYRSLFEIDDNTLRTEALIGLDSLVTCKREIQNATNSSENLLNALNKLDQKFIDIVGGSSRRRLGETYGGRGIVYEDCHRDLTMVLSSTALKDTFQPLELVMTSARWFTHSICRQFEIALKKEFTKFQAEQKKIEIYLPDFWLKVQSIIFKGMLPIEELASELRLRWENILLANVSPIENKVELSSEDIYSQVTSSFPQKGYAWRLASHQCPDIMFCAQSPEHLLNGQYLAVLGEVHIASNTLTTNSFASQHSNANRLLKDLNRDLGTPYIMPKLSPMASGIPTRTQFLDDPESAIEIVFSSGFIPVNRKTAIPIADLNVIDLHGCLMVQHRKNTWCAPLIEVLGDFLSLSVINHFGLMHKRDHTPRVTIDKLVVQRETWSCLADDLTFACIKEECELFRMARMWRDAKGLPNTVFLKMSWEDKPIYIDFNSIVSVRILAKQIRNVMGAVSNESHRLTFSEVLPNLDELWLTDLDGKRFTSEFRFVAMHKNDIQIH